jgi:hypothetical protein
VKNSKNLMSMISRMRSIKMLGEAKEKTMSKWADYLVSGVRYDADHNYISKLKVHEDKETELGTGELIDRALVIKAINNGKSFETVVKAEKWERGQPIIVVKINSNYYLKTTSNNIEVDNLENLPEV